MLTSISVNWQQGESMFRLGAIVLLLLAGLAIYPATAQSGSDAVDDASENIENLAPPSEQPISTMRDKSYLCLWNNSNYQVLYISIRFEAGGMSDFTINPGGMERRYVGDGRGLYCWQYGSSFGGACPNRTAILQHAGNCPW